MTALSLRDIPVAERLSAPKIWVPIPEMGSARRQLDPKWVEKRLEEMEEERTRKQYGVQARIAKAGELAAAKRELAAIERQKRKQAVDRQSELARLHRERVAVELRIAELLSDNAGVDVLTIMDTVLLAHKGTTLQDIRNGSRIASVALARQHVCYELRRLRNLSYPKIARIVGLIDHTSARHNVMVWPVKAKGLGIPCEPINGGAA